MSNVAGRIGNLSRNHRPSVRVDKHHRISIPICILAVILGRLPMRAEDDTAGVALHSRADRGTIDRRSRPAGIRSEVKLVLIPVTVTDPYEHPVQGLSQKNFRVYDEGVEQNISQFFSEEAPVTVGIVVDASNSMRNKIEESRHAISEFLGLSTPGDEFSLLKFSDRPEAVCGFTQDTERIENNVADIQTGGWTSLYDALYLALNRMKQANNGTKALLVFSDGGDNNSRYSERDIKSLVREADVRVFAISIMDHASSLERISDESGGRAYRVHKLNELPEMAATLSAEIHNHYVIAYLPRREQNDGKYHKVTVKLTPPDGATQLHVAWRHGYYAALR